MRRRCPLILLAILACNDGVGPTTPVPIASISLAPTVAQVEIGGTRQLTAIPRDASGNPLTDRAVTWSSSDEGVATVDASGVVRGIAGGQATITADSGNRQARAFITVLFPAIGSVQVTAAQVRFLFGRSTQLSVTPRTAEGIEISGCATSFASSDPAVGTVIAGGLVTGVGVGQVVITATVQCGGVDLGSADVRPALSSGQGTITLTIDPIRFTAIAPGGAAQPFSFACGIVQDGTAYCWGGADGSHLGTSVRFVPAQLPGPVARTNVFAQIVVGVSTACGVTPLGQALCWGVLSNVGSSPVIQSLPTAVGGGVAFRSLDLTSTLHNFWQCGVSFENTALCWGVNRDPFSPTIAGWLGIGSTTSPSVPTPVAGSLAFSQVTTGKLHACGSTTDGAAYCWGVNDTGQLGTGVFGPDLFESEFPVTVVPTPVKGGWTYTQLSAGGNSGTFEGGHTCGITTAGSAVCWGENGWGQLGDGSLQNRNAPVVVGGGMQFQSISAGGDFTCALTPDGAAFCWGFNREGQLGNGTTSFENPTPVAVAGGLRFIELSSSQDATCGIGMDGFAYCWGRSLPNAGIVPSLVPGQR